MFLSQRVQRIKESPTLAITAKAGKMKASGIDVVSFGAGEPDFDTPGFIKDAAIQAINSGFTKYTPVGGIEPLKDAIIAKLQNENGLTYAREEILVSCGGKHSLYNIFQAILNPGDEVIIPAPYWVSYPDQVLLNDGKPVILTTSDKTGFKVSAEQLEKAITPKTKAFVLNSPSNPTGACYSKEDLEKIAKVLVAKNILCISDEIYEKVVYEGFEQVSIASFKEEIKKRTVIVNGASKVFSMTGWRMAFAAGSKEIISSMSKIQGQVTSNITSITQKACVAAYQHDLAWLQPYLVEYKKRRDYLVEHFNKIPAISCFNPQGSFYVFPNISGIFGKKTKSGHVIQSSDDFANYLLNDHQVAVVPGEGFGAPGFIRLSYATSMEQIQKGMERIEKAISILL